MEMQRKCVFVIISGAIMIFWQNCSIITTGRLPKESAELSLFRHSIGDGETHDGETQPVESNNPSNEVSVQKYPDSSNETNATSTNGLFAGTIVSPQGLASINASAKGLFTATNASAKGLFAGKNASTKGLFTDTNASTKGLFVAPNASTKGLFADTNASTEGLFAGTNASSTSGRLYATFHGRLGNRLFMLADAYALARTNSRQLVLPPQLVHGMEDFLNVSFLPKTFEVATIPQGVKSMASHTLKYLYNVENLPDIDLRMADYVFNGNWFVPYVSDLQKFMVLRDDLVNSVQSYLRFLDHVSSTSTLVGIHVRRTDRTSAQRKKWGDVTPGPHYLRRAMTYFLQKYQDIHFVVVSDDLKWCRRKETFLKSGALRGHAAGEDYSVHFTQEGSTGPWDLTLLTQCNHTIFTIGSYGWWGGWFAGGEAIYFNNSVKEGSRKAEVFNIEEHMWPGWIGMGDAKEDD